MQKRIHLLPKVARVIVSRPLAHLPPRFRAWGVGGFFHARRPKSFSCAARTTSPPRWQSCLPAKTWQRSRSCSSARFGVLRGGTGGPPAGGGATITTSIMIGHSR